MADQELSLPPKSSASSALKLLNQVEYYFSDLNLATTDYLVRFITKDPQGFVPVSVVASLKKIKPLVTDHRQLAAVLRSSSKLVVSDDGKKVKRLSPISVSDIAELQSRIVVAENLPRDQCRQNLMKVFSAAGSVKAIQTSALRSEKSGNICHINKLHAYVEYESTELAEKAIAELNGESNRRSGLRVRLMTKCTVVNRNKIRSKRKKKTKTALNNSDVTPLARSERDEKADSDPISEHGGTPPIQPSVSPEILTQSQHPRQVSLSLSSSLSSTTTPGCFTYAAGHHVLSGVTDKRKCRPRGLLAVTNLSSTEDALLPYPSPSHALVQWRLSPSDASCESYSATPPLLSSRSSADSPYPLRSLGSADSTPFLLHSLGSAATVSGCSSGNVIRTPSSDSTPHTFASQLDSVAGCLRLTSLSPVPNPNDTISVSVDASFQFETLADSHTSADLTHFRQLVEGRDSCSSLRSGMVSSRDVSLSEIYEIDDELDCCRCLSDDETHFVDAGIFEDKDKKGQEESCRDGCCAESISVDEGGLLASSMDSDWAFVLQKQ